MVYIVGIYISEEQFNKWRLHCVNYWSDIFRRELKNETEADEITKATKNIQYYSDKIIDADYLETDTLNGILISALLSINYSLDCLRGKLSITAAVFQDCLSGNGDMESIYADVKALEKKKK